MKIQLFTILVIGVFITSNLHSQEEILTTKVESFFEDYRNAIFEKNKYVFGATAGVTIDFGFQRNNSLRFFLGVAIVKKIEVFGFDALPSFQSELEFYRGGLGSSLLKSERYKFHAEWRNYPQITFGEGLEKPMSGKPLTISIGQSMSVLFDPFRDWSFTIGSCFINKLGGDRNQQVGFGIIGVDRFQFYYANDGPPYHYIGLGDEYDRWWTGSGQFGYFNLNDNSIFTEYVLRYDKFTGYQEFLYELGNILQVDHLQYKNVKKQFYNQGRFQYRFGIQNMSTLNISIYKPKLTDIQDMIHKFRGMPYHFSLENRRYTYGFTTKISGLNY